LADLYRRDPAHADIVVGSHGPTQVQVTNPVDNTIVNRYNVAWTVAFSRQWVRLFTTEASVVRLASAAMPIIGLCELGNCPQTTGCGVLRPALGIAPSSSALDRAAWRR
jgi:hypothetical protein